MGNGRLSILNKHQFVLTAPQSGLYGRVLASVAMHQARMTIGEAKPIKEKNVKLLNAVLLFALISATTGSFVVCGFLTMPPSADQVLASVHYLLCTVNAFGLFGISEIVMVPLRHHIQQIAQERGP